MTVKPFMDWGTVAGVTVLLAVESSDVPAILRALILTLCGTPLASPEMVQVVPTDTQERPLGEAIAV